MARMTEEKLLSILQAQEDNSAAFTWGELASERETSMKEYYRLPYGTEQEGWSQIVTSDVQDTVEWMLPALLKIFTSTDQAVSFDPVRAEDVQGAQQATDTCNYVFYKQNDGFLVLYTAFKDALNVKNCAVMWRKEKKRVKSVTPVKGATAEMLAMVLQQAGEDAEIEAASERQEPVMGPGGPQLDPMTGQPVLQTVYDARICTYEEKTRIKVEAFPPEELLVKRDWTSPMLDECPYVARHMRVTLSDLHEMGFNDVTADDLQESDDMQASADKTFRDTRVGQTQLGALNSIVDDTDDESQTEGYMRMESALIDWDGDGIAERRWFLRLKNKILLNEESDEVPFATTSPILNTHRWDGMSVAETVSDLQRLRTELTRQMVNSAVLANNPRTKVLTDANWSPLANVDDLLTSAPGRILRQRQPGAIEEHVTPWVGGQMFPMLEYIDHMREQRTGISRAQQGIDANALRHDRTAAEVMQTANAAAARIELIARIFAETLVKPIFKGIFKLLTDGEMEKLAFRLRGEFVQFDPNEWRDGYDMSINVGLGTGDKQQQAGLLQMIFEQQGSLMQGPLGAMLVKPKQVYNTVAKLVENAGFKNVGDFYVDPGDAPLPDPGPPPEVQKIQMQLQAKAQADQQAGQMDMQKKQAELQLQATNDARDAEREERRMQAEHQLEIERIAAEERKQQRELAFRQWEKQLDAATKLETAAMSAQAANAATQAAQNEITREITP